MTSLRRKLDRIHKSIKMLNNGTNALNEILQEGRTTRNMRGLGLNESRGSDANLSQLNPKLRMLKQVSQHHGKNNGFSLMKKVYNWKCHQCGRLGHIRPFCYNLYGFPPDTSSHRGNRTKYNSKKAWHWVPKNKVSSLIDHTSLQSLTKYV